MSAAPPRLVATTWIQWRPFLRSVVGKRSSNGAFRSESTHSKSTNRETLSAPSAVTGTRVVSLSTEYGTSPTDCSAGGSGSGRVDSLPQAVRLRRTTSEQQSGFHGVVPANGLETYGGQLSG